jgi:arylsulfatase A-like enzyme
MPSLLDLLGVDVGSVPGLSMQGRSFADALLSGSEPKAHVITSELRFDAPGNMSTDWLIAQHYQGWKFLHDGYGRLAMGKSPDFLYDLAADPGEKHDQAATEARRLAVFQQLLSDWRLGVDVRRDGVESVAGELSREQLEQLVELGYIDAGALK